MAIDGWRIHRKIGMSGGLFTRAVGREIGHDLSDEQASELQDIHDRLFRELLPADERRPLPGAQEILAELRERGITHGIATSGRRPGIDAIARRARRPRRHGRRRSAATSPAPSRSPTCSSSAPRRLEVEPEDCYVIGDAVWDLLAARRARMLSIGLLSGGYGADELQGAGAFRVYRDAAELQSSLDELGVLRGAEQRDPHRALAARALRRADPAVGAVAASRPSVVVAVARSRTKIPRAGLHLRRREVPGVGGERDPRAVARTSTGATEAPNAGGPAAPERARDEHRRARRPGRGRRRRCPARPRRAR